MKTYDIEVELEQEDGIWTAVVPSLPGCNAWAYNKKDVLIAIQENTKAYIETLIEDGQPVTLKESESNTSIERPSVAITI